MKFGVVVFPGSNCDDDMMHVLGTVLGQDTVRLWHKDPDLTGFGLGDCIVLPGGFSFGDYLRAGAIARFSPIMQSVADFAARGGLVFGICNGFQILCEAGLLPGILLRNEDEQFICKNVHIRPMTSNSGVTNALSPSKVLKIPIAHAEGRYFADEGTLRDLKDHDQILFTYCNERGDAVPEANPNGSLANIAGICNRQRNVFGMMPHPERASEGVLGNKDGYAVFESLLRRVVG
jgi:phosphoribosylformylglycinamidine synthase I